MSTRLGTRSPHRLALVIYDAPVEARLARLRAYVVAGILTTMAVAAVSCADDSTATPVAPVHAPAPPPVPPLPPTPPVPPFAISGIVIEYTASDQHHPAAGVLLSVISEETVTTTSDASGRFRAEARGNVVTIVPAETAPYLAPCPGGGVPSRDTSRTFTVNIVSKEVLSTTGMPGSIPLWIYVSGTVSERGPDGLHPLAGASVSLMGWWGIDSGLSYSTTLSDALGRYTLCTAPPGAGTDQLLPLRAAKDGYFADSLSVLGGWTYPWHVLAFGDTVVRDDSGGVHIELVRKP